MPFALIKLREKNSIYRDDIFNFNLYIWKYYYFGAGNDAGAKLKTLLRECHSQSWYGEGLWQRGLEIPKPSTEKFRLLK